MPLVRMIFVNGLMWVEMMMVVTLPQGVQESMMQAHGQVSDISKVWRTIHL